MLRGRPRDAAPGRAWTGLAGGLALWAGGLCAVAGTGGAAPAGEPVRPRPSPLPSIAIAGMTLEVRQGRLVIDTVQAGSPAASAGLLAGDTVLVVNDFSLIDLDPISPQAALTVFEKEAGRDVRMIVGRGAGTLGIQLPLTAKEHPAIPPDPSEPPGVGSEAPKFAARGLKGEEVVLEALRGKPVLIEFWAAWCPPCRDSVIPLLRLAGEYGDRLVIVGVSLDTDPKAFEAFAYNHHLPGHQILDGGWSGPISRLYGVAKAGIPYSVLIDPAGKIASAGDRLQGQEEALVRLMRPHAP